MSPAGVPRWGEPVSPTAGWQSCTISPMVTLLIQVPNGKEGSPEGLHWPRDVKEWRSGSTRETLQKRGFYLLVLRAWSSFLPVLSGWFSLHLWEELRQVTTRELRCQGESLLLC